MSETTKEKNHKRLLELLSQSECMDCGVTDIRVLTFDHVNPKNKTATVSSLIHKGHPWDVVQKEINKTNVVCQNCHLIREDIRSNSKRQQYWFEHQRAAEIGKLLKDEKRKQRESD